MQRVLVVDDDPDLLILLRLWLETARFDVQTASDGREALDLLWAKGFDAVVLDIRMPVLDGWAVLEALQEAPVSPPVVVASAHCGDADKERAMELGAAAFIDKPFEPEQLTHLLEELVGAK